MARLPTKNGRAGGKSGRTELLTPIPILDVLRYAMGRPDFDLAGHPEAIDRVGAATTVLLPRYRRHAPQNQFCRIGCGLKTRVPEWASVFCNPPWGVEHNDAWSRRYVDLVYENEDRSIAFVVPASIGAAWWRRYALASHAIWIPKRFRWPLPGQADTEPPSRDHAPFDCTVFFHGGGQGSIRAFVDRAIATGGTVLTSWEIADGEELSK